MPLIAPSILSADLLRLREQIDAVERAGADWIHLDVMDGRFVPNITFGPLMLKAVRHVTALPLDAHLMIVEPERYLRVFREAGADIITVHLEACPHLQHVVHMIKELGAKAGVAINPATPVELVGDILGDIDLLLVMSVNPGFGGQEFIHHATVKIQDAAGLRKNLGGGAPLIEVDGGISVETIGPVCAAGADVIVAGNAVFGHGDPAANLHELKRMAASSLTTA
ncbi:MAG: ribulose-phosphate 3-epimerase [Ignavibacteriales bacterium CG07_land_8_20_14_0_80_59_12]|nr:MAG: ribulose-phosphate 3-epimerase [Ignavibacteriales bacterium CG07_land_8_20_14_0_80_59_12]